MMVTRELADPFRRDALALPVRHLAKYRATAAKAPADVPAVRSRRADQRVDGVTRLNCMAFCRSVGQCDSAVTRLSRRCHAAL